MDCFEPPDRLEKYGGFYMEKNMKVFLFLCCLLVPFCASATDMCARDDTMVLVFDPQVNGSGSGNTVEWTWFTVFPYGRVAGEATCLSKDEGLGRTTGQGAYYGEGDYAKSFIDATAGLKGLDNNGNERMYCWCRMTHPVLSKWVYNISYSTADKCKSDCVNHCGKNVPSFGQTLNLRVGAFNSIGL